MEQQMMMLEGANMQAATVNALKAGNDAMKKQMKEMNVDAVQDVMDDVADQMEEMQEITEALGQDLSGGMFDESELEAEFAYLEEELLDEQLLDISAPAVATARAPNKKCPSAPTAPQAEVSTDATTSTGTTHAPADVLAQRGGEDWTKLPRQLDANFEILDVDAAVRPTKVSCGPEWTKRAQAGLVGPMRSLCLRPEEQRLERNRAYDLLDALSRSGSLPLETASLHLVVAATHCFAHSVIETVIEESINPIEKFERTSVIVATAIHRRPVEELLQCDEHARVATFSPMLFDVAALPEARALAWPQRGRYPSWWEQAQGEPPSQPARPELAPSTEDDELAELEAQMAQ